MFKRIAALALVVGGLLGMATPAEATFPHRWDWRSIDNPLTVSSGSDRGYGRGSVQIAKDGSTYSVVGTGRIRKTPAGGDSVYWKLNVLTRRSAFPNAHHPLTNGSSSRSNDTNWVVAQISWLGTGPLQDNQGISFVQVCIDRRFGTDPCSARINSGWR